MLLAAIRSKTYDTISYSCSLNIKQIDELLQARIPEREDLSEAVTNGYPDPLQLAIDPENVDWLEAECPEEYCEAGNLGFLRIPDGTNATLLAGDAHTYAAIAKIRTSGNLIKHSFPVVIVSMKAKSLKPSQIRETAKNTK